MTTRNGFIRSLDAPLWGDPEAPSLLERIASPAILSDANVIPVKKYRQGYRVVSLDRDMVEVLQKRFPGIPCKKAIRRLLGLEDPSPTMVWTEHENEVIHRLYPNGGVLPVWLALDKTRTRGAIRGQASKLGVQRKTWNPFSDYLTKQDVKHLLHVTDKVLLRWEVDGLINSTTVGAFRFYSGVEIVRFIQTYPFKVRMELLPESFRSLLPNWTKQYYPPAKVFSTFPGTTRAWLYYHGVQEGRIRFIIGYGGRTYYNINDIATCLGFTKPQKRGRRRVGEWRMCDICGKPFYLRPSFAAQSNRTRCSMACLRASGHHKKVGGLWAQAQRVSPAAGGLGK